MLPTSEWKFVHYSTLTKGEEEMSEATTTSTTTAKKTAAKKPAAKKTAKAKKPAAEKKTGKKSGDLTPNQTATLKALAKVKTKVGLTRKELQKAIDATTTGYPILIAKGYVVDQEPVEGERAKRYAITSKGKSEAEKAWLDWQRKAEAIRIIQHSTNSSFVNSGGDFLLMVIDGPEPIPIWGDLVTSKSCILLCMTDPPRDADQSAPKPKRRYGWWMVFALAVLLVSLALTFLVPAYRQLALIERIEAAGGTIGRERFRSEWFRNLLGEERVRGFDNVVQIMFLG